MATCGSLQHIFENPLPINPSVLEPLSSWKPIDHHSFTDIFREVHWRENTEALSSLNDQNLEYKNEVYAVGSYSSKSRESFCLMNSERLQLCTEGLGFESLDDVEELKNKTSNSRLDSSITSKEKVFVTRHLTSYMGSEQNKRAKSCIRSFPPPISCLGRTRKPSVCFKSYRQDGRFVLQEVKVPTQEYLHASREDGRLRLSFVQPDDDGDDDLLEMEEGESDGAGEENDDDDDEENEIVMQEEYVKGNS